MNTHKLLYPADDLQKKLRELGVYADPNLAVLGELLPVGVQTIRSDGFWYCMNGHGFFKADKEVDARAMLLIFLLQQEIVKLS